MLPPKHRWQLRATPDFFTQATRTKTSVGLLYFQPHSAGFQAQIVTPKTSFPRSVDRHAAKRRLSEELKKLIDTGKAPSIRLVIIANRVILTQKPADLRSSLEKSLVGL